MAATGPQVFALGGFTADLSQSGGRVVSNDELMSEVWPDVFVTEDSLTQCVHEVREALGADHAGLLKTVPDPTQGGAGGRTGGAPRAARFRGVWEIKGLAVGTKGLVRVGAYCTLGKRRFRRLAANRTASGQDH